MQSSSLKQELQHEKIYENNCGKKENEWLPYLKNDILLTAFSNARYTMAMEELTGFVMKISLTLPSLANKFVNSLRNENDEPIYANTDLFMRSFVRQSIQGGRCIALNQYYKSTILDKVFNIIWKELGVIGNICKILANYFEITYKQRKKKSRRRIRFTI